MFKELSALHQQNQQQTNTPHASVALAPNSVQQTPPQSNTYMSSPQQPLSSITNTPQHVQHMSVAPPMGVFSGGLSASSSASAAPGGAGGDRVPARGLHELNNLEDPSRQEQFLMASVGSYLPATPGAN